MNSNVYAPGGGDDQYSSSGHSAGECGDGVVTFGLIVYRQFHENCYTIIRGMLESAKEEMTRRFGTYWSKRYPRAEEAGVEEYGLKEIK